MKNDENYVTVRVPIRDLAASDKTIAAFHADVADARSRHGSAAVTVAVCMTISMTVEGSDKIHTVERRVYDGDPGSACEMWEACLDKQNEHSKN